jgi:hypothetical protein
MILVAPMVPARSWKAKSRWFIAASFACSVSCHHAPPPPPPPRPPQAAPEPPPPPKCETPEEACVARNDTRASIRDAGWDFAPPVGWTYAQGAETTIAIGRHGALAVTTREKGDDKSLREHREEMLRALAAQIGVLLPKKKHLIPKKPDQAEKISDLDVDFFQLDGSKREGKKGPLLIFTAELPERQVLLGVGFVSDDDEENSDGAIMNSIHSMARAPAGPTKPKSSP